MVPHLHVQELTVRVNIVYEYLYMLQNINGLYKDIKIDQSPAMITELESITRKILHISNIEIMEDKIDRFNDAAATGDSVIDTPEENFIDNPEIQDLPMPSTFVTRMTPTIRDENQSRRNALNGMLAMVTHQNVNQTKSDDNENTENTINEENDILNTDHLDISNPIESLQQEQKLYINRDKTPFNEFINNDLLLYCSFPFLFHFGKRIQNCGTIDKKSARHMLLQFHGSFASCHQLIFLLFDQLQRHAASQVVASRVKCNPKSFESFVEIVNDPNFIQQLKTATKNPSSKESIDLLKKLSPHIISCTSRIPFTSAQRSAEIMNLIAMRYFYGMPCIFLTYAPDDIHGVLNMVRPIDMWQPHVSNGEFGY